MDKELYFVGLDEGNGTCIKPCVCLFKIGDRGVLQLLDTYNLELGLTSEQMQQEVERASIAYEKLYKPELQRLSSGDNTWYFKHEGTNKIKVVKKLLDQIKNFDFR